MERTHSEAESRARRLSYQWKRPFDVLELDAEGALQNTWWAIRDSAQILTTQSAQLESAALTR
jgi:hypothetical protein